MTGLVSAFDTHKFIKQMMATGFTEEQAETQVNLLTEILGYQLSTKADVAKLDAHVLELKRDIKELDAKTEIRLKELDTKMEIRFKELDTKMETRLKELDTKMETRLKELDTKMETRFKEFELRMVIKTGAMIIGGIGLLFGLMRAWPLPVQYVPPVGSQEMRLPVAPAR
ncbi:MAG: hypothetical protein HQL99_11405 [Magnetococcales bacterium]|nr:hypothetical protein [Magnetococcales bacterium]